tara:strand:- start:112 stop:1110 length:999 start_codon:yes stop_codon:yes gene_type:complete
MDSDFIDSRISQENKLQFKKKGWTLIDLKLPKECLNNAISGLKIMKHISIRDDFKPRRIYYDHLFTNNLAAIELPFNQNICNEKIKDFFVEAKIGSLVRALMDWNNPCCDLARLFCMGNFNYRGNWHRDYDSDLKNIQLDSDQRNVVLVGIYLLPQKGFRILKKEYEYNGNKSLIASKKIDNLIRRFPFPLSPIKESYDVIDGKIGTALFFDPLLLHQGSNNKNRLDFHMKFHKSNKSDLKKNKFQDFSIVDILHEKYELKFNFNTSNYIDLNEIPLHKRSSIFQRFTNSLDYRTCLRRILKIKNLKSNKDYIHLKKNGWEIDSLSNTIFQK